MRRYISFILLFFTLSSFASIGDDIAIGVGSIGVTASAVSTQDSSGVIATDTTLKNLLSKRTEIESVISLERNRTFDVVKKRDTLKQNLSSLEQ